MGTVIDGLTKELADMRTFAQDRVAAGLKPIAEEQARMSKAMQGVLDKLGVLERDRVAAITDGRAIVREGRLVGYDMLDLRILESVMRDRHAAGKAGTELLHIAAEQRAKLRQSLDLDSILAWEDNAIRKRQATGFGAMPYHALEGFRMAAGGWTRTMMNYQQKALDSTTASAGDELVPTFEAAELWMAVNLATLVLPTIPQIMMPTNPFDMPRQFGDTNWYPVDENIAVTTTDPTTGKATLTAYGLKTGVPFSDELEEDAIIAFVPELRSNLVRNAAEVIDDVLLNGDTTLINNINADGATIAKSTAGKGHWVLGFDGLIHLPLVDNTGQRVDKNAAVDADIYNRILALMRANAVPRQRGDVVYFSDVNTATRSLSITEFETADVAGGFQRATLSSGEIISVYGKPLVQSAQMRLADTDGLVTDAGNATSTGRILCVNTTQWRVGFRRQITVEPSREAGKGQTVLYVSMRIALTQQAASRGTARHTALAFDITGVA